MGRRWTRGTSGKRGRSDVALLGVPPIPPVHCALIRAYACYLPGAARGRASGGARLQWAQPPPAIGLRHSMPRVNPKITRRSVGRLVSDLTPGGFEIRVGAVRMRWWETCFFHSDRIVIRNLDANRRITKGWNEFHPTILCRGRLGFDRAVERPVACRGWSAGHVKS